jgi:NAD(P)H-hydrate epimerase
VLTGIVAALSCRLDPFDAAWAGAALHGLAAEYWTRAGGGDRGLLAHEIADLLPRVMASALKHVAADIQRS